MSDLMAIHINALLRLSKLIYFYIDKRNFPIESDELVCYAIVTREAL